MVVCPGSRGLQGIFLGIKCRMEADVLHDTTDKETVKFWRCSRGMLGIIKFWMKTDVLRNTQIVKYGHCFRDLCENLSILLGMSFATFVDFCGARNLVNSRSIVRPFPR